MVDAQRGSTPQASETPQEGGLGDKEPSAKRGVAPDPASCRLELAIDDQNVRVTIVSATASSLQCCFACSLLCRGMTMGAGARRSRGAMT